MGEDTEAVAPAVRFSAPWLVATLAAAVAFIGLVGPVALQPH